LHVVLSWHTQLSSLYLEESQSLLLLLLLPLFLRHISALLLLLPKMDFFNKNFSPDVAIYWCPAGSFQLST
jgi:hypothetical protein